QAVLGLGAPTDTRPACPTMAVRTTTAAAAAAMVPTTPPSGSRTPSPGTTRTGSTLMATGWGANSSAAARPFGLVQSRELLSDPVVVGVLREDPFQVLARHCLLALSEEVLSPLIEGEVADRCSARA